MTDRTAPARTRRTRAAGAVGASALALALLVGACSGSTDAAAHGAGPSAAASASPPQVGVVDTNPADPPQLQPTLHPGSPVPTDYRALPATRDMTLLWNSTAWLSRVQAAGGAKASANDFDTPAETSLAWRWSTAQIGQLEAGVQTMLPADTQSVSCSAQTFEPASAAAASQITNIMLLCAQTGLSGGSTAAAEAWIRAQIGPELKEINGLTSGRQVVSATPAFGSATYYLATRYVPGYGYLIELQVW